MVSKVKNTPNLEKFLEGRIKELADQAGKSKPKYHEIWGLYEKQMPACIRYCTAQKRNYPSLKWFEGPQGIYWIGEDPKIFFVGRDHYGWYPIGRWPENKNDICLAPLEFMFFAVESMGDYFGKVKTLILEVMGLDTENWAKVLKEVAFSNACKCLTNSSAYNNELHLHCLKNKYLENEILTVNAPLNVLFTRSQLLSSSLFAGKLKIQPRKNSDFIVSKIGKQVIIECDHPGRKSKVWQNSLIALMKEHYVGL